MNIIRTNWLTKLLYILILTVVIFGVFVGVNQPPTAQSGLLLGRLIDELIPKFPLVATLFSLSLVVVNSFMINKLYVNNILAFGNSSMPALIYLAVATFSCDLPGSLRATVAAMLIIAAVSQVLRSYDIKSLATGDYLNIGFYFGFAASIYEPSVLLLPLIMVALATFRFFSYREWIAAIVGFMLPIFLSIYGEWLISGRISNVFVDYLTLLTRTDSNFPTLWQVSYSEWAILLSVALLTLLSVVKLMRGHTISQIKITKTYIYFVWMLVVVVVAVVFIPCRSLDMLPIVAIALSVLIASYMDTVKRPFFATLLYVIILASVLFRHLLIRIL